jgi:hypothetical protein
MRFLRTLCELRVLIPILLLVVFAADLASRTISRSWYAFRAWEAVENQRDPGAPFHRNQHSGWEAYGDLAALGNLPAHRAYRREFFSTDEWGYRTSGEAVAGFPPGAILTGDSFAVGQTVNDEETLAARLSMLSGLQVYNAGGRTLDLFALGTIARRLKLDRGTVIYEYLDRTLVPEPPLPIEAPKPRSRKIRPRKFLEEFFSFSPLSVVLRRIHRKIEDDRILPNPSRKNVVVARLKDGSSMLFLPDDDNSPIEREPEQIIRFWRWFAAELGKNGLDLLLVLVPNKSEVYGPLALDYQPKNVGHGAGHERVIQALRSEGILALDLTPILREKAEAALKKGEILYWPDDTHWNREGIRLAAEEIYKVWHTALLRREHR